MNIKNALVLGIFMVAVSAMALDSCKIMNVTARQRYPWYGKVDISFEVVGNPATQDAELPFVVAESDGFRKE